MRLDATKLKASKGGNVIKQGNTASVFSFQLLDENDNLVDGLNNYDATVYLSGKAGKWSTTATVEGSTVSFTISDVLPAGRYTVEIVVEHYVFPSSVSSPEIIINPSVVEYATDDVATLTQINIASEIKKQISGLSIEGVTDERLIQLIRANVQNAIAYDDTELRREIEALKAAGVKGDTGAQGERGEKGEKGDKGDKGDPGEKGDKGDKGDTGSTGAQGAQGVAGIAGANGQNGADGKSAYELAQQEGFTGTLTEWLASLKGRDGISGTGEIDTSNLVTDQELEAKGYLTRADLPTAVDTSSLVSKQELADKHYLTSADLPAPVDTSNFVTNAQLDAKGYLTAHQDISGLATKDELTTLATKEELKAVSSASGTSTGAKVKGLDRYDKARKYWTPVPYFYPDYYSKNGQWENMLSYAADLGFLTVNPASGPGASLNTDWETQIKRARAVGAQIIGYVSTRYSQRPKQEVLDDVAKHIEFYAVDGVFLDEATNGWNKPDEVKYYQDIHDELKAKYGDDFYIIANSGTTVDLSMLNTADIIITFESSAEQYIAGFSETNNDSYFDYPRHKFWHIIYEVTDANKAQVVELMKQAHVGWYCATDDVEKNGGNPYDNLPSASLIADQVFGVSRSNPVLDDVLKRLTALEAKA